jgi:hypothetical protein
MLGKEHPSTLQSVWWLAWLCGRRDQYEEAILLYKRAYDGFQKSLGPGHPKTSKCRKDYLALLDEMKQNKDAVSTALFLG